MYVSFSCSFVGTLLWQAPEMLDGDHEVGENVPRNEAGKCREWDALLSVLSVWLHISFWSLKPLPPAFRIQSSSLKYGPAVDTYSFAIVMYEIATRQMPWKDVQRHWTVREKVLAGERPAIEDCRAMPVSYTEIMQRCWAQDPGARPTMMDVLRQLQRNVDECEV